MLPVFWALAVATMPLTSEQSMSVDSPRPKSVEICISAYEAKLGKDDVTLGLSAPEAVRLTHEIVSEVGASNQPTVVPCGSIEEALAFVEPDNQQWPGGISVPAGEYILYNQKWAHQVLGEDDDLAVVVLGHEVGHLMNRDFSTTRVGTSMLEREKEADRFAGCAAARRAIAWPKVPNILSRLREDYDSDHPKKADSLSEAQAGYNSCLVAVPLQISASGAVTQSVLPQDQPPGPRSIDWNAEKILVRELSALSSTVKSSFVYYTEGVVETMSLSQQLTEVFARSGLKANSTFRQSESPTETGLIILRWKDSDSKLMEALRTALAKAGLVSHFVEQAGNSPLDPQALALWVAPQPM